MKISNNALAFMFIAAVSSLTGCANQQRASFISSEARALHTTDVKEVEVLLDRAPSRPFRVVGELSGRTIDNSRSIDAMKDRAAGAGLDGIYWIDCSSQRAGRCTAKGYVYTDATTVAAR